MKTHKYRKNYNTFLSKYDAFDPWKYYRQGLRYHEQLPSGFFTNQTWGALNKAWVGYCIARDKFEPDREIYYAKVIQKLQKELGLEVSEFECLS
ncbi:MAG TPA: hypothetical protein VK250_07205 [Nitrososphaeraceae archaeon]|nr:hypothetical protein [Nitrososphaeraceae archaeon]